jgi:transposase
MAKKNPPPKGLWRIIDKIMRKEKKGMVGCEMYSEIQKRKAMGYSRRRCAQELDVDKKTVRKYWDMSEEEYAQSVLDSKRRTRILDTYREFIITEMEEYPSITSAIIDDHLREQHEDFEASYRSVRLYVAQLREEMGIPTPAKIRQYAEVEEQPLGFQAQVDMGEQMMSDMYGKRVKVYIFAMVMSASRMKFVCFQERPFNAQDFIEAHDLAFRYFGGRTVEIVYDQDRVLAVSENAGDILYTEIFESYRHYAGFSVRLCRGYDPESKGKIEAVVKYVKRNFLPCRRFQGVSALNSEAVKWLDRTANGKIHETTKMIPKRVFSEEIKCLKPVPTLSSPVLPKTAIVRPTNVVHYRQNRYAVPKGSYFPGRKARIEADDEKGTVTFYDSESGELLASHAIHYGIGKGVGLPKNAERFKETKYEELKATVLKWFEGVAEASCYIERIMEKYPRYVRDQLSIIRKTQELYTRPELGRALVYCTERELYSANDLRDTLEYFRREEPHAIVAVKTALPVKYSAVRAEIRPLSAYSALMSGGGQA